MSESEEVSARLQKSIDTLKGSLERGVITGSGGNAATRTRRLETLQHSFLQHHQCGILPGFALEDDKFPSKSDENYTIPVDITRGTILLRCNSLLRGHSAVRAEVIDLLLSALNSNITPVIPLRGSISASGDLSPLSYVGGLIEGNPDIFVHVKEDGIAKIIPAPEALARINRIPMSLGAKEELGIVNGIAPSTAAASMVLYDSHNLALLTQVLTAMATEALLGTTDNYHEFISQCRPHPGQTEVARNIRSFLEGSRLVQETDVNKAGLVQDRYALRTAPQWIGPQIEDLLSAHRQIDIELKSSTDNPLIDVAEGCFHHGGNFQAASVTSAMEKTRTALTMLGRILLGQCGELTNPSLSGGLPPNLCADDPSLSFAMKGLDVHMTAYFSELAYLSNSVASHVQTAEMQNQTVNSLALVSAQYTNQSVQILSMMCAVHLYILCQALDLRALTLDFLNATKPELEKAYTEIFPNDPPTPFPHIWTQIESTWQKTTGMDLAPCCAEVSSQSFAHILNVSSNDPDPRIWISAQAWKGRLELVLAHVYGITHNRFCGEQSTPSYLGRVSGALYGFVRQGLGVPFLWGSRIIRGCLGLMGEGRGRLGRLLVGFIGGWRDGVDSGSRCLMFGAEDWVFGTLFDHAGD